jgi:hypothetical protein
MQGQTWLYSVVRVGIVDHHRLPAAQQVASRSWLTMLVDAATAGVLEEYRAFVKATDGIAVCIADDPEEALSAVLELRERLRAVSTPGLDPLRLRIGISLGPVRMMAGPGGRLTPTGDGLRQAEHLMELAAPGQILASRSFQDVIACLSQAHAHLFRDLGTRRDERAAREVHAYELVAPPAQNARSATAPGSAHASSPNTEIIAYSTGWERAELTAAAIALTPYVGGRARALVKEAAERATSVTDLYRLLVEQIPTAQARRAFCREQGIAEETGGSDETPFSSSGAEPATEALPHPGLDPELLARAEDRLAAEIGPLARVLVRRHSQDHPTVEQLLARLAEELSAPRQQVFLEAMRKTRGAS